MARRGTRCEATPSLPSSQIANQRLLPDEAPNNGPHKIRSTAAAQRVEVPRVRSAASHDSAMAPASVTSVESAASAGVAVLMRSACCTLCPDAAVATNTAPRAQPAASSKSSARLLPERGVLQRTAPPVDLLPQPFASPPFISMASRWSSATSEMHRRDPPSINGCYQPPQRRP